MDWERARRFLVLLLALFVGLGVTYGLATPCFESPDESAHLAVVRYIVRHRSFPPRVVPPHRRGAGADVAWYLGYHDPPLYYTPPLYHALAGLLVFWEDMEDLPRLLVPNPGWEVGWAPQADDSPWNKNIYAHRAEESFAQSSTVRAVYVLRLFSLGLGCATVFCAYLIARALWPERPLVALGAAALVALNPQFIAISAGVTNDNLLNALFGLFLLGAVRLLQGRGGWIGWAALGGLAGLGLLTKQTALLLLPLGLLAAIGQSHRAWYRALVDGAIFLATALAVGSWWYVRNGLLYGDPFGLMPHFAHQVPLARFGFREFLDVARSYWAAFGWALVQVEPWVYGAFYVVTSLAVLGLLAAGRPGGPFRRLPVSTRRGVILLGIAFVLNAVPLVGWALVTGAPYGRLLFPTITAAAVLGAWGLSQWTRWRWGRWGLVGLVSLLVLFDLSVPWRYLRPAFASPRVRAGPPETARRVEATFNGGLQLVAYDAPVGDWTPGAEVRVTLYWRAQVAPDRRYRVWVQVGPLDPTRKVAEAGDWLGGSLYPSDLWRAGDLVRQEHRLRLPEWTPAPGLYWVRVGLVDGEDARVARADGGGDAVALGPWRVVSSEAVPPPAHPVDYRLGPAIRLLGYDLERRREAGEEVLELTFHWYADRGPEADYTVFVHLLDGEDRLVGQEDGPPRGGAYPTSWWLPGQVVLDRRVVRLGEESGSDLKVRVGLYDPHTMVRLPVYDGEGRRLPDDAIPLTHLGR
ncbi:MAG TPA: hypothetical protein ENK56_01635 [Chloroflexi bacterium]|nr:hypothetical protein [Chloroflexota bacterium]